jgi:hypothetical protein
MDTGSIKMKCPKCGKLLQTIFAGIASDFRNITEVKDEEGHCVSWLVCNNPDCPDGKLNCSVSKSEDLPF